MEDKDTARAEKLQRELTSTVDGVLQTSEAKAAVLTQTLTQDAGREQQARENNISTGKAALVNRVLALNSALKFDALAKLSVEELKDLAEAGAPAMPIGKAAAAYAAEQYAGTAGAGLRHSGGRFRTGRIPRPLRGGAAHGMGRVRVSGGRLHGESAQRTEGLADHCFRSE